MLKVIVPMMAAKAEEEEINYRLKDSNWVAEEKFDGSRYTCHFEKDRLYFTSRRISVKTGLPVEKGLNLPHINMAIPDLVGTVLDGEIIGKDTFGSCISVMGAKPERALKYQKENGYATFKVFDNLFYKGQNLCSLPLRTRREMLQTTIKKWGNCYMSIAEQYTGVDKLLLFDKIVARGGEGIILKNLSAPYVEGRRNKDTWVKVKKQNSWSCIITGYEYPKKYSTDVRGFRIINHFYAKGWIAAVTFGVRKKGDIIDSIVGVGKTSGMTEEVRKELSENKNEYIGKVIDINGQEVTKGGHIRHPRWSGFRTDISSADCTWENLMKSC